MESKFSGGLLGFICINICMSIIAGITLGFGTPWALCMKEKWVASHTVIDGHQVVFDGTGGQLFGTFVKWLLLTFVTCGIYSFWLTIKMKQWVTKHTHLADSNVAA